MILYLSYFSSLSAGLPIISGFLKSRQFDPGLKSILILLSISFTLDVAGIIMAINQINNMPLYHFYTLIEFSIISFFYAQFFKDFFRFRMLNYVLLFLFTAIACYDAFFLNGLSMMNNLASSTEFIILIVYALLSFFLILKNLVYQNLLQTPFFWINTAVLIYFSGNLFLFLFTTYLQKYDIPDYGSLYAIHSVLNIVYYILISIGFWKVQTK